MPRKVAPAKSVPETPKDPVMDVSRPGKAEPSASGRPLIITRKPMIQDPMVKEQSDEVPGPPSLDAKSSRLRNFLTPKKKAEDAQAPDLESTEQPTNEAVESKASPLPNIPAVKELIEPDDVEVGSPKTAIPDESEDSPKTALLKPGKEAEEAVKNDKASTAKSAPKDSQDDISTETEKEPEEKTPTVTSNSSVGPSVGLVDELAKQAVDKKSKDKQANDLSEKEQKINKLVSDKTYFLPIGSVTRKRKNKKSLIVLLLFVLIAVGGLAAVDAGLIDAPFDIPFDFIQN